MISRHTPPKNRGTHTPSFTLLVPPPPQTSANYLLSPESHLSSPTTPTAHHTTPSLPQTPGTSHLLPATKSRTTFHPSVFSSLSSCSTHIHPTPPRLITACPDLQATLKSLHPPLFFPAPSPPPPLPPLSLRHFCLLQWTESALHIYLPLAAARSQYMCYSIFSLGAPVHLSHCTIFLSAFLFCTLTVTTVTKVSAIILFAFTAGALTLSCRWRLWSCAHLFHCRDTLISCLLDPDNRLPSGRIVNCNIMPATA